MHTRPTATQGTVQGRLGRPRWARSRRREQWRALNKLPACKPCMSLAGGTWGQQARPRKAQSLSSCCLRSHAHDRQPVDAPAGPNAGQLATPSGRLFLDHRCPHRFASVRVLVLDSHRPRAAALAPGRLASWPRFIAHRTHTVHTPSSTRAHLTPPARCHLTSLHLHCRHCSPVTLRYVASHRPSLSFLPPFLSTPPLTTRAPDPPAEPKHRRSHRRSSPL